MSKVSCSISFAYFEPSYSGYKKVMQSSAMGGACDSCAESLASSANLAKKRGTYEAVPYIIYGDRAVALVHTGDFEAIIDENKRKTLSRLVS